MDFEKILQHAKASEKLVQQVKTHTRDFEKMLEATVKGAPEGDKQKIEEIRVLSIKAIELAKQGKGDEAQQLIKNFGTDGR